MHAGYLGLQHPDQLLSARRAAQQVGGAAPPHRSRARLTGNGNHFVRRLAPGDGALQLRRGHEHFSDRDAPVIAGERAFGTSNRHVEHRALRNRLHQPPRHARIRNLFASGAKTPDEALRDDTLERTRELHRIDPEVCQAGDRAAGVVCVKRREHEVAGERCL